MLHNKNRPKIYLLAGTLFITSSCFDAPGLFSATGSSTLKNFKFAAAAQKEADGILVAKMDAHSKSIQEFAVSAESNIKSAKMSIPPGALAIDTEITMEEGGNLASQGTSSELGLVGNSFEEAGAAVAIESSVAMDTSVPLTISIPLPRGSRLTLLGNQWENLVIIYRVISVAEGTNKSGLITGDMLTVNDDGTVSFPTTHFGLFQSVVTAIKVEKAIEVVSVKPILSKRDEESKPEATWSAISQTFTQLNRNMAIAVSVSGVASVGDCALHLDNDRSLPYLQVIPTGGPSYDYKSPGEEAESFFVRFECTDNFGRGMTSDWTAVNIPLGDKEPPAMFSITAPSGNVQFPVLFATWEAAADAVAYTMSVSSQINCSQPTYNLTSLTGTSTSLAVELPMGTTWYICMSAMDRVGNVRLAANNGVAFTVSAPPPPVAGYSSKYPSALPGTSVWAPTGTYALGADVDYEMHFAEPVVVTGTPFLALNVSMTDGMSSYSDHTTPAVYVSGSGTSYLIFRHYVSPTVTVPLVPNGYRVSSPESGYLSYDGQTINLGGGAITNASGTPADLNFKLNGRLVFAKIFSKDYGACGLTPAGNAYCWGANWNGQLGDGSIFPAPSPVAVAGNLSFSVLSVGSQHTCGLTTAGAAYCWGSNGDGQLGTNSVTKSTVPMAVATSLTFSQISAGGSYTCAIENGSGAAYCWGANYSGQLGNNTYSYAPTQVPAPVLASDGIPSSLTFSQISSGSNHTCGLSAAGTAYCWGDNYYVQLGNNTNTISYVPSQVFGPDATVNSSLTFSQISSGANHTCGLTTGGAAFCWGNNGSGQLGNNSTTWEFKPVPVLETNGSTSSLAFSQISSGTGQTCGLTTAGGAYCWGYGFWRDVNGQDVWSAISVPTVIGATTVFSQLASNYGGACGLTNTEETYCWGANWHGQLGNGTYLPSASPLRVTAPGPSVDAIKPFGSSVYRAGNDGSYVTKGLGAQIDFIVYFNEALTVTNTPQLELDVGGIKVYANYVNSTYDSNMIFRYVVAAGQNDSDGINRYDADMDPATPAVPMPYRLVLNGGTIKDRVGLPVVLEIANTENYYVTMIDTAVPTVTLNSMPPVSSAETGAAFYFSAGNLYNSFECSLDSAPWNFCWSGFSYGGMTVESHTFSVRVGPSDPPYPQTTYSWTITPPPPFSPPTFFQHLAAGAYHSCALDAAGHASCSGYNGSGQLGTGTITDSLNPIGLAGGLTFIQLASEAFHSCGLTAAGEVYCWGQNNYGQLGTGATSGDTLTPVKTDTVLIFSQIAVGREHTCALTGAGKAYCWGKNWFGQLGNNSYSSSYSPTPVLSDAVFNQLAANVNSTCGITATKTYCWGETGSNLPSPSEIITAAILTQITAGGSDACGLTATGAAYCWGPNNLFGQFGNGTTDPSYSSGSAVTGGLTFSQISMGEYHSCGVSTTSGLAYCWGRNDYGQLGNNSTSSVSAPTAVNGTLFFSELITGQSHTCGITITGDKFCWGYNGSGQLGNGSTTEMYVPTAVSGLP
jgi:alpha-tubulin suppressor-like RCC1 family protein